MHTEKRALRETLGEPEEVQDELSLGARLADSVIEIEAQNVEELL